MRTERQLKEEIVNHALAIDSYAQFRRLGLTDRQLFGYCVQISNWISEHRRINGNQMLAKTPEGLMEHFQNNLAVLTLSEDAGTVLFHAAIYPSLERGEDQVIGCQVVEGGGAIANPEFQGMGMGANAAHRRLCLATQKWGDNFVFISTIKKKNTARALVDVAMANNYHNHPYISFLACTCPTSSEICGFERCVYRRSPEQSTPKILARIYDRRAPKNNDEMDCTLVISDPLKAAAFEARCRQLNRRWNDEELLPQEITGLTLAKAKLFFDHLAGST